MTIFFQIVALVVSVLLGGILSSLFSKTTHLKLLLSFSGGFLITVIFLHILPESYEIHGVNTGFFVLTGFLMQLALEYFSKGAEHGHFHLHAGKIFPWAIVLSLCIHAFLEALPLGASAEDLSPLFWGILLHKIPEGVTLSAIFLACGFSRRFSWSMLIMFSIVAPAGFLIGYRFTDESELPLSVLLAVVTGMLIHVSTTIIFESSESHKISFMKLLAIVAGFLIAALIP